jgi:hypothetical protein
MAVPVITKPGNQVGNILDAITPITIAATETPTKIEATGLPAGLSIAETGAKIGEITGTPTTKEVATVTLKAENAEGVAVVEPTFTWTIKEEIPVLTPPGNQTSNVGQTITPLQLVATGGTATEFSQVGSELPAGLSLAGTGLITGTPTTKKAVVEVEFKCRAADGTNSAIIKVKWTVTALPVITKPADQSSHVGEVATPVTIAISNTPTLVTATGLPKGLSIKESGAKIGEITGTPDTVKAAVEVTINAENAEGSAPAVKFKWTITVDVPVVTKPAKQISYHDTPITPLHVVATGTPTVYTASSLPAGLSISASTGVITGTPTTKGTSTVKLAAENAGGASAEVSFEWVIQPGAEDETAEEARNTASTWVAPAGWGVRPG